MTIQVLVGIASPVADTEIDQGGLSFFFLSLLFFFLPFFLILSSQK